MENNSAVNRITITGEMITLPTPSHENHGRRFYGFAMGVERLSGTMDRLNVVCPWELLGQVAPDEGGRLKVCGQIRSFNSKKPSGSRLVISVLAKEMKTVVCEPENLVELRGVICKEPIYRQTPLGREICDVMLAVERGYGKADYLPVIVWGASARAVGELSVGAMLGLEGRLQSRQYIKCVDGQYEQRTAYEVSAAAVSID